MKKLEKKANGYKKYIKKVEDTILQKDEKLKYLEMFKKNSDLCSLVESSAPRTEKGDLENFGIVPQQPDRQAAPTRKAENMLNSEIDDALEPELAFDSHAEFDDLNEDNMGLNGHSDLPGDFDNGGLNIEGLDDGQVNTYNDLGEFCADDDMGGQQFGGEDAINVDGSMEQHSPGFSAGEPVANDLDGFEE